MENVVINVDEEGKTMCSIIQGKLSGNPPELECLFVHTFTVEEVPESRVWIRDIWKRRVDETGAVE